MPFPLIAWLFTCVLIGCGIGLPVYHAAMSGALNTNMTFYNPETTTSAPLPQVPEIRQVPLWY